MIEQWVFRTIIAFISIQVINFVFSKYLKIFLKSKNQKPVGTFRAILNSILLSMIPIVRWIMVLILIIGVLLGMNTKIKEGDE